MHKKWTSQCLILNEFDWGHDCQINLIETNSDYSFYEMTVSEHTKFCSRRVSNCEQRPQLTEENPPPPPPPIFAPPAKWTIELISYVVSNKGITNRGLGLCWPSSANYSGSRCRHSSTGFWISKSRDTFQTKLEVVHGSKSNKCTSFISRLKSLSFQLWNKFRLSWDLEIQIESNGHYCCRMQTQLLQKFRTLLT